MNAILKSGVIIAALMGSQTLMAQQPEIQYFRDRDQNGINVFETTKDNTVTFEGIKVRIGGNFTQQFQALSHSNAYDPNGGNAVPELYHLSSGFNLATANLNFDIQLEDGIRVTLENYMSSRHHSEFWVKGGYIQIDKLPMFNNTGWFDDHFTVRIGHFQPNYGDMQFRRTDNGNALYNPFVGNSIMDAFTTEIGGDVLYRYGDFFGVFGMTAGLINGDVQDKGHFNAPGATDSVQVKKNPSVLVKLGWDKQLNDDLRLRLTGSYYFNSNSSRNTLYAGDRTGSRFYLPMEAVGASAGTNFTSGRVNPNFTSNVSSFMINPFVKFKGLEFFGMFEMAQGYTMSADYVVANDGTTSFDKRTATQIMAEVVYRFLEREQLFVGARYNTVSGKLYNGTVYDAADGVYDLGDQTVDRIEVGAGWFMTRNLLLKASYVTQTYNGFDQQTAGLVSDIRKDGQFSGLMVEAVVGF